MGFNITKLPNICQDNAGAIAMCTSDKFHSRTRFFRVHMNVLRDAYNRKVCYYPWVLAVHVEGDLFNKTQCYQPAAHGSLVEANGMFAERVTTLPDKGQSFKVDGWLGA